MMLWAVLPWRRCKAALEPNETPYWGRCERLKKHDGWHALERGFDVVWFSTQIVDFKQEWQAMREYAEADINATLSMMEPLPYGPPVKSQSMVEWVSRSFLKPQARYELFYKDQEGLEWKRCDVSVGDLLDGNSPHLCVKQFGHVAEGDLEHQAGNGMTWVKIKPNED